LVRESRQIETRLAVLQQQKEKLQVKVQKLDAVRFSEMEDVRKLEQRNLAYYFHKLLGDHEERYSEEQRQAMAATVKYEAANRELLSVVAEIDEKKRRGWELCGVESEYESALKQRADQITNDEDCMIAADILALESTMAELARQKKRV